MSNAPTGTGPYWYPDPDVRSVLEALRRFRRADQEMRRRVSSAMDMNTSDLQALQLVIAAEQVGKTVSPRDLSAHLGISTASTTTLVDRLTASGHLERTPHPTDRRGVVVRATCHAHSEVRQRLERMHRRMAEIASAVPPEARGAVVQFLESISDQLDAEEVAPLTPAEVRSGTVD